MEMKGKGIDCGAVRSTPVITQSGHISGQFNYSCYQKGELLHTDVNRTPED